MATAEARRHVAPALRRRWAWAGLAVVLAVALALRLWGVRQGLPFAYNTDESQHFVPHAIRMFAQGTLDPRYFANPPAYTYVLHVLYALWYGGGAGAQRAFALHPADVYTLARVTAALLGAGAVWLLYLTGARLFDRATGLLAAAIVAVAFLPVFYAHLALNDVPTMAPATLSLLGSAGVLRRRRLRDYALAGVGLGLACASKYTAGIVILPLLAAAACGLSPTADGTREGAEAPAGGVALGLVLAAASALGSFLIANPYALLDYTRFHTELAHQSSQSAEAQGKLGAPRGGGLRYYLWTLTWGLGWAPALAALGGAVLIFRRDVRAGWMLVPAPVVYLAFMGLEGRYFGRWLLPIFPILALLAAWFAVALARTAARRLAHPAAAIALLVALVVVLLAQGLVYSVHAALVLSRTDTRTLTRRWLIAHVPAHSRIVAEPVSPGEWANEQRADSSTATNAPRWNKYASLFSRIEPDGSLRPGRPVQVSIEDYVRTLSPALIPYYEREGFCWVISGSTQSGRAFADPRAVPLAIAYYRALAAQATIAFRASPYRRGASASAFNFDWSFDYYPLAYERPGPVMTVYRLHGGACARAG